MHAAFVLAALLLQSAPQSAPAAREISCDILIAGGSFGGCAAAVALEGRDVWMVEDCDWIGGQVTSQGVSALDEHKYIESFGGTQTYIQFRNAVRSAYGGVKNPGGGWVSRLCFEPKVGLRVLEEMTRTTPKLLSAKLTSAEVNEDRVVSVCACAADGSITRFLPKMVLDATDTGELLALAGIEHRTGTEARAETGEPHAAEKADPNRTQSFTYPFAVEFRKGERHESARPRGYERFRDRQPYSLDLPTWDGKTLRFGFFEKREGTPGPFWTYRRLTPEIAMINWPGNDYRGTPLLSADHDEAKRLSLGFLHWLQTECPRDDGGRGYPELLLRRDVMGTEDGLSKRPYVREGRRLVAKTRIVEQDLTPETARARLFADSVGLGWYSLDLHSCAGEEAERGGLGIPTKPFQIPLGALVPQRVRNVIAAGKCLGVTHVTNGAYRLHPIEWNCGESAAHVAAFCLERGKEPAELLRTPELLRALQARLLDAGIPIFWLVDLSAEHPAWAAAQALAVWGEWSAAPDHLEARLTKGRAAELVARYAKARARAH